MIASGYVMIAAVGLKDAFQAFSYSDGVGQGVVVLLLVFSVVSWTIMIDKGYSLYSAKKSCEDFSKKFRTEQPLISYIKDSDKNPGPVARVYESGAEKLLDFYKLPPEQILVLKEAPPVNLTPAQLDAIRAVLEREVSIQILQQEERMPMLATAVSVSPFFGLFGTVWGVMMAFCGIAVAGKADFNALAPGISGALLTTIVGLLVAIPSLIGYNLLNITIRTITIYMDNFVEEFITRVKLEQLEDKTE